MTWLGDPSNGFKLLLSPRVPWPGALIDRTIFTPDPARLVAEIELIAVHPTGLALVRLEGPLSFPPPVVGSERALRLHPDPGATGKHAAISDEHASLIYAALHADETGK